MDIIIADKQDITRIGLTCVLERMGQGSVKTAASKHEIVDMLSEQPQAAVFVDYSLIDIQDIDELLILSLRFTQTHWVLWCEELTTDFLRRLISSSSNIGVLFKDCDLYEIEQCITATLLRQRFICQRTAELLLATDPQPAETVLLTPTETEILKDIAWGMTTREIAERRFSSFHTVNTHRKNIFRKLGVNNVHEATRYALRAGLIDAAEYYI